MVLYVNNTDSKQQYMATVMVLHVNNTDSKQQYMATMMVLNMLIILAVRNSI